MHFLNLATLSVLPAALAQYADSATTTAAAPSSSSTAAAEDGVHIVKVGDGGLVFEPADIKAAVGEVVEFHFWPQAHSVAQSSFDQPCQPLNTTGFFSGPVPVSSGEADQVFRVTVGDEKPLWFYCATGQHCQGGMVGVINAPADGKKTLEQYAAAAADAESNVAPSTTGGGELTSPASATGGAASSAEPTTAAGIPAVGDMRWGLMSFGVTVAGLIGGMLV